MPKRRLDPKCLTTTKSMSFDTDSLAILAILGKKLDRSYSQIVRDALDMYWTYSGYAGEKKRRAKS